MSGQSQSGIGYSTVEDAQSLSAFDFDDGERFIRWHPWGDERADEDVWAVTSRSWQYTVSWVRDRDNVPTLEEHRRYTMLSRETFDELEVSEADLKRGDWRQQSEVEQ